MTTLGKRSGLTDAIVTTITQPLLVLDESLRVDMVNPAFLDHFKVSREESVGRYLYELGNGQWDIPDLRRLLKNVLTHDERIDNFRVEHHFESIGDRIMLVNANRMRRGGTGDRILLVFSDITESERLRFELEGQKEFAEKVIDSVREALLILGRDLRIRSANQSFYDRFRVTQEETEGRFVYELGNRQWNIPELRRLLEDVLPKESSFDDYEVQHDFERVGRRTMLLNARRLDHLNLIVLAIRDITDQRRSEVQQKALVGELQHRVKNILNNVRALSAQTRRNSRGLDDFFAAFEARLGALARTQDLIVRSPVRPIALGEMVKLELEAVGAVKGENYHAQGPEVHLTPHDVQALAMTIHELTTNAAKYGALKAPQGRVEIAWRLEPRKGHAYLSFDWRERGVRIDNLDPPPGFGTRVIRTSLPHMLGGTVDHKFCSDGVACRLEFPIAESR